MRKAFKVEACWDDEAKVWFSQSDIFGLHIEAATLDEFEALVLELAPDLILQNHVDAAELLKSPLADSMPAIIWRRPDEPPAACA